VVGSVTTPIVLGTYQADLTAMSERSGVSKGKEDALLAYQKALFEDWYHQVRDGTVSREEFQVKVGILRQGFKTELEEAVLLLGSPKRPWQRDPRNL
jgi:hypothetical protein